ncbi:alpha/beta hydrolase fold domain-containing protein, partial [Actinotignum timonense]|nr:alpha/beta hydrolase fold domain-containing protein [Actinotignum timonense]
MHPDTPENIARARTWTPIDEDLAGVDAAIRQRAIEVRKSFVLDVDIVRCERWHTPDTVDVIADIPYLPDGETNPFHRLDLYLPHDAYLRGGKALPVYIDIHGGGFVYGTKDLNKNFGVHLAERGCAVFSLSYRLAPAADFLDQLRDVLAGCAWIARHLDDYPVDPDSVVITGDSAGASDIAPGNSSAAQLAEARARLTAAIKARDAILAEIKASGASLADIQSAAQAYARANAQVEAAQQAYDAAVAKASGFDSAKKGYDDAASVMPQLTKNAESARARRDAAQASYDKAIAPNPEAAKAAQEKVDAARAKLEESKAAAKVQWDRGALGFYEARNAQKALDVFTTNTEYQGKPLASYTHPGAADDATNLDSMAKTLSLITKINELRAAHQLEPLKVTDYLMAVAQLQVNAQSRTNKMTHIKAFNVAENLASANYPGDELSLKLWYHNEKALHDQGVTDFAKVGHYLNIVNPNYSVTGMAFAPNIQANTFDHTPLYGDNSQPQTVADYSAALQSYMNGLKDEMAQGSSVARTALADATAELEAATKGDPESLEAQIAKTQLETAAREYDEAKAALDTAQTKLTAATAAYESAKAAKQAVQKLAEQLNKLVNVIKIVELDSEEAV